MRNILMIDLETTGKKAGCRVLSIGACGFNLRGEQVFFYKRLKVSDQATTGLKDDESTLNWWKTQPQEIYDAAWKGEDPTAISIAELKLFFYKNFSSGYNDHLKVWCCGADFDFPILAELFRVYGHELPWKFYSQFDYRTIKNLFPEIKDAEKNNGKHSALEDAKAQMRGLRKFFEDHPNA